MKKKKKILYLWILEKGNVKKINLLYRATRDGDTNKDFYNKCKKKGATISFIKTKKGRRFGGFTKAEWTDDKGWITLKDENPFLFSLDNREKFDIIESKTAIRCIPDEFCLVFGNNCDCSGICIKTNF